MEVVEAARWCCEVRLFTANSKKNYYPPQPVYFANPIRFSSEPLLVFMPIRRPVYICRYTSVFFVEPRSSQFPTLDVASAVRRSEHFEHFNVGSQLAVGVDAGFLPAP
jgi:hypothetical protein